MDQNTQTPADDAVVTPAEETVTPAPVAGEEAAAPATPAEEAPQA